MDRVFVYWDNPNIFHEAQRLAEENAEGPDARDRVRIHFPNTLRLAHADRPVEKATAVGSVPPELRQLWNRMESRGGVKVYLFDRGAPARGEQEVPDRVLQLRMLEDALDYNGDPGIVALLTGDGAGSTSKAWAFTARWRGCIGAAGGWISCRERIPRTSACAGWAEANGIFVPLDDFYDAITFMEPSRPGFELAPARPQAELDLSCRRISPDRNAPLVERPKAPMPARGRSSHGRSAPAIRRPYAGGTGDDTLFHLVPETGETP